MIAAPTPVDETERLADLRALKLLDTPAEERFDRIVTLATQMFAVPIAYVALVDSDRQWFKSKTGMCDLTQTGRTESFCGHAIMNDDAMVVPDTLLDHRFVDNPMVVDDPHLRFYVGHPVKGHGGHNVGTLCIADYEPREFTDADAATFAKLAAMVEHELKMVDLIATQRDLIETKTQLVATREKLSRELDDAARYVRSMLPSKLNDPVATDYEFIASSQLGGDLLGHHWVRCDGKPDCTEGEKLAVYLFDVTGHGVASALLSISVYQSIRRQTLPDTDFADPAAVLTALNRAYPMDQHGNKFFTIWYGVYDPATRSLTYASAGHPPALLFPTVRQPPLELGEGDLMIGAMPDVQYANHTVTMPETGRLFVYSDGAFEVRLAEDNKMLGLDGLRKILCNAVHSDADDNATPLKRARDTIRKLQGTDEFEDDYTMLELRFGA